MRVFLVATLAACVLAGHGDIVKADNYGGVSSATRARMIRLIHHYFDPTGYGDMMVRCAARESGFNPRAANWDAWGSRHEVVFGILQVKWPLWAHRGESVWHFKRRMMDPVQNLRLGVSILHRQGIAAWGGGC